MIFYNLLYFILKSTLCVFKPFLGKKTKTWIDLRNNQDVFQKKINGSPRIWIHASSGEIEYAKSLIREYKKTYPQAQIFVSYSSLSATSLIASIFADVTAAFPLNWDANPDNNKLLDFIKPDVLIFSRTDFWLNLITLAYQKNVKLAAIAANPKMTFLNGLWHKMACSRFKYVSCVDDQQVLWLKKLLPNTQVELIPDTRYDQVFFRLSQNSLVNLSSDVKLMTFGSTWPKDDEVLLQSVKEILEKKYSIVWAPHDIKYAQHLKSILNRDFPEIKTTLLADHNPSQKFDILIVDRIGVLADFYRYSHISFIGGSFVRRVHSVMEPLCAGNFVIVGPYYKNSPEAILFSQKGFVKNVFSSTGFLEAISTFESKMNNLENLKKETQKLQGGTQKTVTAITQLLQKA